MSLTMILQLLGYALGIAQTILSHLATHPETPEELKAHLADLTTRLNATKVLVEQYKPLPLP